MDAEVDAGDSSPALERDEGSPSRVAFVLAGSTERLNDEGGRVEGFEDRDERIDGFTVDDGKMVEEERVWLELERKAETTRRDLL